MHKGTVVDYYGGISKTAVALGVTHSAVCQWGEVIPETGSLHRKNYKREVEIRRLSLQQI